MLLAAAALPAQAQSGSGAAAPDLREESATGLVRFNILVRPPSEAEIEAEYEDCGDEREPAAEGQPEAPDEIVVCVRKRGEEVQMWSKEDWENRYAARTAFRGAPRTPDVAGPGITGAGAGVGVVVKGCFIPPCPPPPAYMIDFAALPDTPPGSDAERVGQGLAPRGYDGDPVSVEPVTRRESASPAAAPSGSASPREEPAPE